MEKLILIVSLMMMTYSSNAQDITSWDMYPQAITDEQGHIAFRHVDPVNGDEAFAVYIYFKGGNRLQAVYMKQADNCFLGTRSVKNNESYVIYNGVPCNVFNSLRELHESLIPKQEAKPLEDINEIKEE